MGNNSSSRFSHGVRDAVRACSGGKRRRRHRHASLTEEDDDEARLNTCDSEPLDRGDCGGHERAVSVSRAGSRTSSLAHLGVHDGKAEPKSSLPRGGGSGRHASVSPRLGSRRTSPRIQPRGFHQHQHLHTDTDIHPGVTYQSLGPGHASPALSPTPCCCNFPKSRAWLVDQESQTVTHPLACEETPPHQAPVLEAALSKEYIVKTYSIQHATPSPSPATQTKFADTPTGRKPRPSISPVTQTKFVRLEADTPIGLRSRSQHAQEWTPSPPSTLQIKKCKER
ncbi:hypothetical protein EGW08_012908 [Elysia chlorotica]|uniref:Uncharacterized protein n=1 Tax=Elysia chlorotica TaxID=188477 RepID=A0A3S0ZNX6_ELYCH|nr:hypothetical protein EGW08_012908 [Elysia chlorotica]